MQLFSGTILHDATDEPEAYLEPVQHLRRSIFTQLVNGYKL